MDTTIPTNSVKGTSTCRGRRQNTKSSTRNPLAGSDALMVVSQPNRSSTCAIAVWNARDSCAGGSSTPLAKSTRSTKRVAVLRSLIAAGGSRLSSSGLQNNGCERITSSDRLVPGGRPSGTGAKPAQAALAASSGLDHCALSSAFGQPLMSVGGTPVARVSATSARHMA